MVITVTKIREHSGSISEAEKVLDDLENRIDEMQKSFEIAEQNYNECVKVIDNAKAVINENARKTERTYKKAGRKAGKSNAKVRH